MTEIKLRLSLQEEPVFWHLSEAMTPPFSFLLHDDQLILFAGMKSPLTMAAFPLPRPLQKDETISVWVNGTELPMGARGLKKRTP